MNTATTTSFDPKTDADAFRAALGQFVTGVTVVTTDSRDGPIAIVANSFASVSLDPPLVLWCPAKASRRFEHFAGSRRFAVHVLAQDQRDICTAIIESKTAISKTPTHLSHCGMPLIDGVLACFECSLSATHDAGDHAIVVGEVTKATYHAGVPLVFQGGRYGRFSEDA